MGRLLLLALFVVAAVLVWKAFGPGSWKKSVPQQPQRPAIKGPDDDEEFLWKLEKERFKERRARERAQEDARKAEEETLRRMRERDAEGGGDAGAGAGEGEEGDDGDAAKRGN